MIPLTCGNADQTNGSSLLDQRKDPCRCRRLTQSLLGTDLSNLLPLAAHRGLQGFYAGPDRVRGGLRMCDWPNDLDARVSWSRVRGLF